MRQESDKFCACGASGLGKTTRLCRMIQDRKPACTFAFDPKGQIAEGLGARPIHRFDSLAAGLEQGLVCYTARDAGEEEKAIAEAFNRFCSAAYQLSARMGGVKVLAIDELQNHLSTHAKGLPKALGVVNREGRHYSLALGFTCQTLNEIHNVIRAQLSTISAFRHQGDAATDYLSEVGFPVSDLAGLVRGRYLERQFNPPGPVMACDDFAGVRRVYLDTPALSPALARIFAKGSKRTR